MNRHLTIPGLCLLALIAGCLASRAAVRPSRETTAARVAGLKEASATPETVAAAQAFLATLDDAKRAHVRFTFDAPERFKWSNFPVGVYPRSGVRWGDLAPPQRDAALKLLGAMLSRQGLQQVREIMDRDEVLKASEAGHQGPPGGPGPGGGPPPGLGPPRNSPPPAFAPGGGMHGPSFGRDEYYLAFFGAPSLTDPWMIQFGGHHLAINLTIVGTDQVLTPSLPAAQPAVYKLEGRTVRPLGGEHDKSLTLIHSLDAAQQRKAILPYEMSDLVLGPGQDGKTIPPEGIKAAELSPAQQEMLLDLCHEWVGILNDEAAATKMAEIRARLPETWFAWSGPTQSDASAYFRIQGPTLVIEYSPQRSRGNGGLDATHVHTIYRDPTNDYGAHLLAR